MAKTRDIEVKKLVTNKKAFIADLKKVSTPKPSPKQSKT